MKKEVIPAQVEMIADYANTFGTDSGKRVLEDLKKLFCGECYTKNDPYDTIYNLGQRNVVLKIMMMIKMSELPLDIVEELTAEI